MSREEQWPEQGSVRFGIREKVRERLYLQFNVRRAQLPSLFVYIRARSTAASHST